MLRLLRKWEQQPWTFNKQGSLTELPSKLNLLTTACNIYDSHMGCDGVQRWVSDSLRYEGSLKRGETFTKRHGDTSQTMCKNLKSCMQRLIRRGWQYDITLVNVKEEKKNRIFANAIYTSQLLPPH